jgi:hypothetical protein
MYSSLEKYFNKIVQHYKEDFTVYDRELLSRNPKWVISGMRRTGTNLITSDYDNFKAAYIFMFEGSNTHFFICENGKVCCTTKEKAIQFLKKRTGYAHKN